MDLRTAYPRSIKDKLGGYVHLARMIDKCRATLAGTQGEYIYPCPMDQRLLEFVSIKPEQFARAVKGHTDKEIVDWFRNTARLRIAPGVDKWNHAMLTAEPDTEDKWAYFKKQRDAIDPTRTDIRAWADLLDLEEKRPVPKRTGIKSSVKKKRGKIMKFLQWMSLLTITMTISWSNLAIAGELPHEAVLPLALATKAAAAAVEKCTKDGYKVTAAVVDRAGVLKALMRADGAGPHTPDSSRRKAYTAASTGRTTSELGELMVKMPHLQELGKMNDNILILGGALPIQFGNEVVGGIGVGGAPGTHLDDACAQAGLDAIGAEKKVPAGKK